MLQPKHGLHEISHEDRVERRMQVVYARKTHKRQVFMEDLKAYRKQNDKRLMKTMIDAIGPKWYQALSVPQRSALDTLEDSIYQDLLEGRPIRSHRIMNSLGIYPPVNTNDLMNCIYLGRDDPKEMLAQVFMLIYGHTIDGKRSSYDLNGRFLLTSILYLGLQNLIHLLRERFRPDQEEKKTKPKPKPKNGPPLKSPYLQEMVAHLYEPERWTRKPPPPLPNLDELNEPFEEDPPLPKPPPPPPPPPPPKKRLPRAYCDKIAGVMPIEPHTSITTLGVIGNAYTRCSPRTPRRLHGSKFGIPKKVYGIGRTRAPPGGGRRKRPPVPNTGNLNAQYTINGVCTVNGKPLFVLGNISVLPAAGELIHGGHRLLNGEHINIHCGIRGYPPPPKPDSCDCVKKWTNTVFQYVKRTKCYCGHRYDFRNEGVFLPEELPFFQKPTRHSPFQFNYNTIFDIDAKRLHVGKEFKRVWDTESVLQVDDGTKNLKKAPKKKKRSSATCLGDNPKPVDYLKCALRLMRRVNIASRLPDIHLVPELREWMRRRLYGPYTRSQRLQMITKSNECWQRFTRFATHGMPHFPVPKEEEFSTRTTWIYKQSLNDKFRKFIEKYKLDMFRLHADFNNLMWPSMYHAEFPDKKFREIYFSYVLGTKEDLQIMHPYCSREAAERYTAIIKRPYTCPPAGTTELH